MLSLKWHLDFFNYPFGWIQWILDIRTQKYELNVVSTVILIKLTIYPKVMCEGAKTKSREPILTSRIYISHIIYLDYQNHWNMHTHTSTVSPFSPYCIRHLFKEETRSTEPGDICDEVYLSLKDTNCLSCFSSSKEDAYGLKYLSWINKIEFFNRFFIGCGFIGTVL